MFLVPEVARGFQLTSSMDYSLVETPFAPSVDPYVATLISAVDGEYLVGQFAAGKNITGASTSCATYILTAIDDKNYSDLCAEWRQHYSS